MLGTILLIVLIPCFCGDYSTLGIQPELGLRPRAVGLGSVSGDCSDPVFWAHSTLGIQQELGLRPERWPGPGAGDCTDSGSQSP